MQRAMKDYSHILRDEVQITVELTKEQQALIFWAFDFGTDNLTEEQQIALDSVIADLKNQLHR